MTVMIVTGPEARGGFWLWIMKVAGPTEILYILNAEVVLRPVWGGSMSGYVGNL